MIDLRSDTVTKPTPGMLDAMVQAEVGDDVFREDPSANTFQKKIAEMFGMEAGLFTPSGVMSNQLALKVLTDTGEEVIIDHKGHIFNYETSAASLISGVQLNPVQGKKGKLNPELIRSALRSGLDWEPLPSVVVVENSTNKGGGVCYTQKELEDIRLTATENDLSIHLDGARIWNAMTATNLDPVFFGSIADTITVSFSKGLGAPVGSMLLASKEHIRQARRYRKMLGGGMRQTGLLTAAADYAVEHNLPLLEEDHRRAKELAKVIDGCDQFSVDLNSVETNILIFKVLEGSVQNVLDQLKNHNVLMVPFGFQTIRATFHHQVGDQHLEKVKSVFKDLYS